MFYIYVLQCSDNSLYTGFTTDIEKRIRNHHTEKGSKYVRSHLPVKLVYSETFETKSEAMKREFEIKSWSRRKKIEELRLRIEDKN